MNVDPLLVIHARPRIVVTTSDDGIEIETTHVDDHDCVETVAIFVPWCDVNDVASAVLAAASRYHEER